MFPSSSGSWLVITVAAVIGFVIGQVIVRRREKNRTPLYTPPTPTRKEKRLKKNKKA